MLVVIVLNIIRQLTTGVLGDIIGILSFIFPVTILTRSFYGIRKLMILYHPEKYKVIKFALWFYFIFDVLGYVLLIVLYTLEALNVDVVDDRYVITAKSLLFPSIQAVGVCIFKSSQDPLAKVSALFYHKIVSIN